MLDRAHNYIMCFDSYTEHIIYVLGKGFVTKITAALPCNFGQSPLLNNQRG